MRSQWCREHIDETAKQCGLDENVVSEVKKVAKFCASNPAFADCGTRPIYRLISIQDEDVRQNAISSASKALESGKHPVTGAFIKNKRLTESDIKKIIDRSFKEVRTNLTEKYKSEKPVSGLGPVPKDHPNHGVGCAQPGSLPAETDAPMPPSLAEAIKNEPHGTSAFHTASEELAAKQNGIAGEMFPGGNSSEILKSLPAWTPAACPACPHVVIQKVLGNKCKQTGSLICDMKECPVERRKQMAQEQGFVIAGSGTPSLQGKPITTEHSPLKVIPVQLTKEQAEAAITSVVRGYFTPKSQEQWTQLKKVGGWDTDLEALEGLRDDAAERIP